MLSPVYDYVLNTCKTFRLTAQCGDSAAVALSKAIKQIFFLLTLKELALVFARQIFQTEKTYKYLYLLFQKHTRACATKHAHARTYTQIDIHAYSRMHTPA